MMYKLHEVYDNFILAKKLADLSEKTLTNYRLFVYPFVKYVGTDVDVINITQNNINLYLGSIIDKDISKASKSTYIRHIKCFLKWVSENYEVNYNYKQIRVPKSPKKQVKVYDENEIRQIFDCVTTEKEWLTCRNKCIIALMLDSGLRQSEVCTLLRKRIDFVGHKLIVSGKGNKERVVPLGRLSQSLIEQYYSICPYKSEYVFVSRNGGKMTCNAVKKLVNKISNKLSFDFSSHKLRHNFATNYLLDQYEYKGQVDIYKLSILLGHAEVETTKRYLHIANEIIASQENISHLDKIGI